MSNLHSRSVLPPVVANRVKALFAALAVLVTGSALGGVTGSAAVGEGPLIQGSASEAAGSLAIPHLLARSSAYEAGEKVGQLLAYVIVAAAIILIVLRLKGKSGKGNQSSHTSFSVDQFKQPQAPPPLPPADEQQAGGGDETGGDGDKES